MEKVRVILGLRRHSFPPTIDYLGESMNVMEFCKGVLENQLKYGGEYACFIVSDDNHRLEIIPVENVHAALHECKT